MNVIKFTLAIVIVSTASFAFDYVLSNNNPGGDYTNISKLPETTNLTYYYDTSNGGIDFFSTGQDQIDNPSTDIREEDMIDGGGGSGEAAVWGDWSTGTTTDKVDIVFDLGKTFKISKCELRSNGSAGSNGVSYFTVRISNDSNDISTSSNWTTLGTNSSILYSGQENLVTPTSNSYGRYVWFEVHGADHQLQLSELAIWGNLNAPPNVGTVTSGKSIFGVASHMIHTNLFGGSSSAYWSPDNTIEWLVDANIKHIREPLYQNLFFEDCTEITRTTELVERYLNIYQDAGINVILTPLLGGCLYKDSNDDYYVDPDDTEFVAFIQWIAELAANYSCIEGIELHNEANLKSFWGDPTDNNEPNLVTEYVAACEATYNIIKAESPEINVIGGAFSGWGYCWGQSDMMSQTGWSSWPEDIYDFPSTLVDWDILNLLWTETCLYEGLLGYCDSLSNHPYRGAQSPEAGFQWMMHDDPEGFEGELSSYWDLIQAHNTNMDNPVGARLYFTEFGYSSGAILNTSSPTVGSEQKQADYLSRQMLILLNAKIKGLPIEAVYWYDLKCDENVSEREANFGLLNTDAQSARTSYYYYSEIANTFDDIGDYRPIELDTSFSYDPNNSAIYYLWQKHNGDIIIPFWRMETRQITDVNYNSTISIEDFPYSIESVSVYDPNTSTYSSLSYTLSNDTFSAQLAFKRYSQWLTIEPTPYVLSENTIGGILTSSTPKISTNATYSWVTDETTSIIGATDAQIISTDTSTDMTDGISEAGGGDYAAHGTWQGTDANSVATCEFNLNDLYTVNKVTLSLKWDTPYPNISEYEVWLSKNGEDWNMWSQWDQTAPSTSRDARITLEGSPQNAQYVRIFTKRGQYQQVLGEIIIYGFDAPSDYLLTDNSTGNMFATDTLAIETNATYSWVTDETTAIRGATDSQIISTDDGNDIIDGISEAGGGDYAVHGTWQGTGPNMVATCQFDLKSNYTITEVMLSIRWDSPYPDISQYEVWLSNDDTTWSQWQTWDAGTPQSSRDCRISLYGTPTEARYIQVFTKRGTYQQILGEIAIYGY